MKCNNCGLEYQDGFDTCPNCNGAQQPEAVSLNPAADIIGAAITDGLFLTMCILMSVSCVFSLFASNLPLLNILFTIFLWLCYSQARKGMLDSTHLRSLSGTTFALYVINYVLAGCIALLGLVFSFVLGAIAETPYLLEEIMGELEYEETPMVSEFAIGLIKSSGGIIAVIFILIAAVIVVLNIFSINKIHKFAKSVYQSVDMNAIGFQNVNTAKVWLYVIGGFEIFVAAISISTLNFSGFASSISTLCDALTTIFAGVLIGRYLKAE